MNNLAGALGRPVCTGLNKNEGSCTPAWAVVQPTGQSLEIGWGYGSVWGGGACPPLPPPEGASSLQPVASCRRSVCSGFRQVSACVAVTLMPRQRNLNLCGSPRSSSESRRPLDVISVCTRPGQHVGLPHWAVPTSGARGRVRVRSRWEEGDLFVGGGGGGGGGPGQVKVGTDW